MRSQPDLDGNKQLDRLTVKQARAGQGHLPGRFIWHGTAWQLSWVSS